MTMRDQHRPQGVVFQPDPDQGRQEGDHVDEDVGCERAAVDGIAAEPALLAAGLPVGLQEEVADEVADHQHGKGFDPGHDRGSVAVISPARLSEAAA